MNNRRLNELEEATEGIPHERLVEICQAERTGRCVVLPCKVGDEVYFEGGAHQEATIEEIILSSGEHKCCWVQYDIGFETCELWDDGYFEFEDIGKTVFLTRAEAEKALEEMKKCI